MIQKNNPMLVIIFLIAIEIGVLIFMVLMRVDTWISNSAIDNCASMSKYRETFDDKKVIVEYPVTEVYENCLKLKGY